MGKNQEIFYKIHAANYGAHINYWDFYIKTFITKNKNSN